jgi:hypothetical protein
MLLIRRARLPIRNIGDAIVTAVVTSWIAPSQWRF